MSEAAKVMAKLATAAQVMESATFLHGLGLLDKAPSEYMKAYVLANPDINEALQRLPVDSSRG